MLALAAVEHRQRLENPEPVDLATVAREAAEQCAHRLAQRGPELELAPGAGPLTVSGDAFLLRQALINLIDNAADFSPAHGPVELRLQSQGDAVRIEVRDRGEGIPDFALPRVFERFYSLARPGNGSRSSGLGLCFVAEVAQLHGGTATLENREGGGAVAAMLLPLR
jgi:two-component system sensor histidine kinase CreC